MNSRFLTEELLYVERRIIHYNIIMKHFCK